MAEFLHQPRSADLGRRPGTGPLEAWSITAVLGGRWFGTYGTAPCPVCQPQGRRDQNALTLANGHSGLLLHCKKSGCDYNAIAAAGGFARGIIYDGRSDAHVGRGKAAAQAGRETKQQRARQLWSESLPIVGTVAETYLRQARGITCALPDSLRFHPACRHFTNRLTYPSLIARVDGSDGFAVHRTFLKQDGSGKADVSPNKAMLGSTGGGAVRLGGGGGRLVVAEGIETALSLQCGMLDGPGEVWAGLSSSGLRGLRLSATPMRLTIAPDDDPAGRAAAEALAMRAHSLGWTVSMLIPPRGGDFNDLLTGKAVAA